MATKVGLLHLNLLIAQAMTLKDKRRIVKSFKDRLANQRNVSVAEVEYQDLWQRSVLGIVTVNTDRKHADSTLSKALDLVEREGDIQVTGIQTEFL